LNTSVLSLNHSKGRVVEWFWGGKSSCEKGRMGYRRMTSGLGERESSLTLVNFHLLLPSKLYRLGIERVICDGYCCNFDAADCRRESGGGDIAVVLNFNAVGVPGDSTIRVSREMSHNQIKASKRVRIKIQKSRSTFKKSPFWQREQKTLLLKFP
jgi:hypothetical protein